MGATLGATPPQRGLPPAMTPCLQTVRPPVVTEAGLAPPEHGVASGDRFRLDRMARVWPGPVLLIRSRKTSACLMRRSEVIAGHVGAVVWRVRSRPDILGAEDGQSDGQWPAPSSEQIVCRDIASALRSARTGDVP